MCNNLSKFTFIFLLSLLLLPVFLSAQTTVATEDDLKTFINNYQAEHPNISKITTTTNIDGSVNVIVDYKYPGKFLGIFPANFTTINTVNSTTNGIPIVDSKTSLWSGLVSKNNLDQSLIVSRILGNPNTVPNAQPNASPSAKAKIIEGMVYELDKIGSESAL